MVFSMYFVFDSTIFNIFFVLLKIGYHLSCYYKKKVFFKESQVFGMLIFFCILQILIKYYIDLTKFTMIHGDSKSDICWWAQNSITEVKMIKSSEKLSI